MSREEVKQIYTTKPKASGNGARLKSYKKHIDKDMVVMRKEFWDKVRKDKKISDKELNKIQEELADRWED